MFGMGSIGNFLPMLGSLGSGFSGGGLLSLGFTLLSGLLTNIGSPRNPGFENFATHPGFNNNHANPGFGTMGGGPNAQTVGSMSGYFGSGYSNDYSILPQTPSGQYYANSGYSYGNQGVSYSPNQPATYSNHPYGNSVTNLQFGGQFGGYMDSYNSVVLPQPPFFPSYQHGQLNATYGSAPAPASQSYSPVVNHYGFGSPQQYNPASTLYGHQNGSVHVNYGQPTTYRTTQGGPQDDKSVVHHHHHVHLHVHDHTAKTNNYETQADTGTDAVDTDYGGAEEPADTKTDYKADTPNTDYKAETTEEKYTTATEYTDTETDVAYEDPAPDTDYTPAEPDYTPDPVPDSTPDPAPYAPAPDPTPDYPAPDPEPKKLTAEQMGMTGGAGIAASNPVAAQIAQTSFGRVPHVNVDSEWGNASRQVAERITGGDGGKYHFGGRDPRVNNDGHGPERNAVWHVFQQNESLRLDLKNGQFYETRSDGSKVNQFHISQVAGIERQAGGDNRLGFEMVGDFLNSRGLGAPNMNIGVGTTNVSTPPTPATSQPDPLNPPSVATGLFGFG